MNKIQPLKFFSPDVLKKIVYLILKRKKGQYNFHKSFFSCDEHRFTGLLGKGRPSFFGVEKIRREQEICIRVLVFPEPGSCSMFWLCRNSEFSTNSKVPVYGGDSACPPEPPLRFAIVSYYLLWSYRYRGVPQRWGGGITCRSPKKSVKKNILGFLLSPFSYS